MVAPGNNASATITTSFNYTSDGSYSQTAAVGQPLKFTDNLGHVIHMRYDTQGRPTSMTDALGNENDATYNLIGQPLQSILPATGQSGVGHSYNQNSYLYPGGQLNQTRIYNESNVLERQVNTSYGAEGEPVSVTGSVEQVTYAYDGLYRRKNIADGAGNTTVSTFNTKGELATITYPTGAGSMQLPSYSASGQVLQKVNGRGQISNYNYNDVEGLVTDIQYPASPSLDVHLTYDSYGRVNSVTDGTGSRSYSYDDANRLTSTVTTYSNLPPMTVSNSFFPNGQVSAISTPAGSFNYTYDSAKRFTGLTNPYGEATNWTYLDNNWLWTQQTGSTLQSTYTYNALGQPTDLSNNKKDLPNTLLSDYSATSHDGAGNLLTINANVPGFAAGTYNSTFQYDTKNQVTQQNADAYQYSSSGNVTGNRGMTFNHNAANQITTAFTDKAQTAQYDLDGNQTSVLGQQAGGWQNYACTYDAENRLTSFGGSFTAGYRCDDMRGWKETSSGRTYFLYGGGVIPLCEMDSAGNVTAVNTAGKQGLISRHTSIGSVYYAFDLRGNTVTRLDSSRNVLNSSTYTAFGVQSSTSSSSDPYDGFGAQVGYFKDIAGATLHLCGARYYSPDQARWLTRDPIWYRGGINLYGYVQNNPMSGVDPSGKMDDTIRRGIGGALAACLANPACDAALTAFGWEIIIGIVIAGSIYCVITQCWCLVINCDPPAKQMDKCDPTGNDLPSDDAPSKPTNPRPSLPREEDPPTEDNPNHTPRYRPDPRILTICYVQFDICMMSGRSSVECVFELEKCKQAYGLIVEW